MSITAMKQALEALEKATPVKAKDPQMQADAIVALRTAIAEAEACEPVGVVMRVESTIAPGCSYLQGTIIKNVPDGSMLYLAPQPAPKQEPIPPGYQLVPLEPTDKMVQASLHLDLSYMPLQEGYDRAAVYKAMLAAAPMQAQEQRKPMTHEQRLDMHAAFECHKSKWNAQSILIDMVEKFHNIKEQP